MKDKEDQTYTYQPWQLDTKTNRKNTLAHITKQNKIRHTAIQANEHTYTVMAIYH